MKYEKLVYAFGTGIIILSSLIKDLHLPFSNFSSPTFLVMGAGMFFFQVWYIAQLKKKIKELESK